MGLLRDLFKGLTLAPADPPLDRAEPADPIETIIQRQIAARAASFTPADALTIPAVIRGVQILASQGAKLAGVAYAEGAPLVPQPRIVSRPSPVGRPYDFTYATITSMVEAGDAYWRVVDRDYDGQPTAAIVLDPAEVGVTFQEDRIRPKYTWRGRTLNADRRSGSVELIHIPLGRGPGELQGHSPIIGALDRLAVIAAVEEFAGAWFASGGVPDTVLKSGPRLTGDEAQALLDQYLGVDGGPRPVRVVSGDISLDFPGKDPAASQLNETRSKAATEIARLLGIPGALMLIETSGASITYTNRGQLIGQLLVETLDPLYLSPIEQAWSDLVPSTTTVLFDARELQTADIATRTQVEKTLVDMGALQPEEVRALEGYSSRPITVAATAQPTPPPRPFPVPREAIA